MKLDKAIQRAYDRLNIIGENADVYSVLYDYKVFREMDAHSLDNVYDLLVKALGFQRGNKMKSLFSECKTIEDANALVKNLLADDYSAYRQGTKVFVDDGGYDYG